MDLLLGRRISLLKGFVDDERAKLLNMHNYFAALACPEPGG